MLLKACQHSYSQTFSIPWDTIFTKQETLIPIEFLGSPLSLHLGIPLSLYLTIQEEKSSFIVGSEKKTYVLNYGLCFVLFCYISVIFNILTSALHKHIVEMEEEKNQCDT